MKTYLITFLGMCLILNTTTLFAEETPEGSHHEGSHHHDKSHQHNDSHHHEGSHKHKDSHHHEGSHKKEGSHHHEGAHAEGKKGNLEAISGEIIDLSCYVDHRAKGMGHKACATSCAKKGLPMGILTDDDQIYLLVEDHEKSNAYKAIITKAAQVITVHGRIVDMGGLKALLVADIKM